MKELDVSAQVLDYTERLDLWVCAVERWAQNETQR